jgi:hypothetical protein
MTKMQEAETVISQHMTNDPPSLGTQYGLGTYRATYKVPPMSRKIGGWIFALALFIICITGIGLIVRGTLDYPDLLTRSFLIVCFGVIAVVILLVGSSSVFRWASIRTKFSTHLYGEQL